jgi:hypothetical protein
MCPNISPVSLVWWLLGIGIQPNTLSSSSMTPIQLWYYTWAGWTGACCISVFLVRYKYCICVHYGNMFRYVRENTTTTTVLSVFPHRHNRHDECCGGGDPRTAEYMYSYCYVLAHCPLTRSHVSFTDLLHTVYSTTQHAQKQYICTVLYSTAWSAPSFKDYSRNCVGLVLPCPIATVKTSMSAATMSRIFIITSDCYNAYYTGLHCHVSTFTMPSFVRGILLFCIIMS